jgi:hypothetical protein
MAIHDAPHVRRAIALLCVPGVNISADDYKAAFFRIAAAAKRFGITMPPRRAPYLNLEQRVARVEKLLRAHGLHEPGCTSTGDMFDSISDLRQVGPCNCWLSEGA